MKTYMKSTLLLLALSLLLQTNILSKAHAQSDDPLTAELARVTALRNGTTTQESTGTRGGGNLTTVDMRSLENLITSGKLNELVAESASKVDPEKSYFIDSSSDWRNLQSRGMIADISKTPYIFSENGNCAGGLDQGTGASTDAAMGAPVCWDLQHILQNHLSVDNLVILGIREEARHFGFDYYSTRSVAEMVAIQLRAN